MQIRIKIIEKPETFQTIKKKIYQEHLFRNSELPAILNEQTFQFA